ncbi:-ATP-dependent Clp protease proteolytic subunit-related protein 1, chloroplastic [Babesia bigemina]|uniref:ATP-dependent Clp protease proteolytic subunit n=1 Tax=Babesia bigemina TaxID=5866 RepID=A0A061DBK9_BABBI|nr:-ATP-dependent Clp protease proteolytic subunit-related protein 1, chloroplastic [Babesia bigemina]CDR98096.1 -ATP-dependent Clp protease proteolytic subunit-related protein 1, chloroplastic [Babesia bigemina]|eukprot:XP_012770282.1 -ATP-dependent Clp protease proteolytic subunit-related protein 1, chloroplastic [Babesia bigemina]
MFVEELNEMPVSESFLYAPLVAVPRSKPPDISSALLNERTIFIGYPIQAELVIAQLLYLDHASQKPITIYINSDDSPVNEDPLSSCDIYALNIVDVMSYVKSDIITVNLGKAYGSAALILASGTPGKRLALPNSFTALRQSAVSLELMPAADICIYSKEILKARRQMICMLARCCGKGEDDVLQTIQRGCYMGAQQAVEYGLVDKIIDEYAVN